MDVLIEYPFTDAVRHMDAVDFVKNILVGQLALKEIVVGRTAALATRAAADWLFCGSCQSPLDTA